MQELLYLSMITAYNDCCSERCELETEFLCIFELLSSNGELND